MKKKDKIVTKTTKTRFYAQDAIPETYGEVVGEGKDYVEILWEGSVTPIRIKTENIKDKGKAKGRTLVEIKKEKINGSI